MLGDTLLLGAADALIAAGRLLLVVVCAGRCSPGCGAPGSSAPWSAPPARC
ncbi:hypothetical protein [Streptomyces kronopolitis]|uniref:hypothetical protein n=1 Tax=Streptomyces kronopolitis TaxID=1612435 RepID=UPI003D958330